MFQAIDSPYLVPHDWSYKIAAAPTLPPQDQRSSRGKAKEAARRKQLESQLKKSVDLLDDLQRRLYAEDRRSLLLVFQAMDAAGKDSTIRAITTGVNPAGFQVFSFKQPSKRELDHDFLWRTSRSLPERGRIGIFNRSYYEEVLVVRVHPEYLGGQNLPLDSYRSGDTGPLWRQRYESIVDHEKHLVQNGTVVVKFFLNVSRQEQRARFLSRLRTPKKHWKFSKADLQEAEHWPSYMEAYEDALNATSTPWAPWYSIPADDKRFMRATIAAIVAGTLESLGLEYPEVSEAGRLEYSDLVLGLEAEARTAPEDAR